MTTLEKMICCFCDTEVHLGDKFCARCNEYKGLMTLDEYERVYGE